MSEYLEGPSQKPAIYCLTGVLMHVGPDANHGHYIAHIQVCSRDISPSFYVEIWQELDTGAWFKFSDETVVPLAGKVKLGVQEDEGVKKVVHVAMIS